MTKQREPYKKVVRNVDRYTREMQYIGAFQASLDLHEKLTRMQMSGALSDRDLRYINERLNRLDK